MYDRYFAKVERNVHLSLASVVFAGDLDPAASDTIRISNRAVVLHNCTFALKPGQRLWVGSNAQLLLSEVHVVTAAANTQQQPGGAVTAGVPVGPGVASSGYGQARPQQQHLLQRQSSGRLGGGAATNGGGPVPVIETAALRLVRVSAHSGSHPGSPRRFTADESGFGSALTAGSAAGGGPVSPLIHVAGGGRLVMRNCRVQVVAPQGEAAGQGAGLGGGAMTGPVPPASPRTAAIAARAAAASGQTPGTSLGAARGSTGGSGGDKSGRPPLTQVGRWGAYSASRQTPKPVSPLHLPWLTFKQRLVLNGHYRTLCLSRLQPTSLTSTSPAHATSCLLRWWPYTQRAGYIPIVTAPSMRR